AGVVDLRRDRLQNAGADAAIVVAAIGGPLGLDAVQLLATSGLGLLTLGCGGLGPRSQRGNASVGRIDDIRRHVADAPRPLEPVRRRGGGAANGAESLLELFGTLQCELVAVVVGDVLIALCDALLELVVAQLVARTDGLRALHRNALQVVGVVRALEVRFAPRRLRHLVASQRRHATLRRHDTGRVDAALARHGNSCKDRSASQPRQRSKNEASHVLSLGGSTQEGPPCVRNSLPPERSGYGLEVGDA